jgi:lipopolysaccharide export system permease protein
LPLLLRYVLKEVLLPFVVWVAFLFLLILVMQFLRVTDVVLGPEVTPADVGRLTAFLAPHFLVMVIPVAFLLAILLGMGRLNEDRELIAMQALGVGHWKILIVPVALGTLLGAAMLLLSFSAEPWGLTAVKGIINEMVKKNIAGDVKSGAFYQDLSNLTLYTEEVDPETRGWTNVLLHDDRDPAAPLLVLAREGRVNPAGTGEALKLALIDGDVHLGSRQSPDYSIVSFDRGEIVVGVEDSMTSKNRLRSPKDELTPGELLQAARVAKAEGGDPKPFLMAYQRRFGQILTPVSFALIGVPLAMSRRRSGRAAGYLFTLFGYIAYYVISRMFENLGSQGKMPIFAAAQLHNLIFAAVGLLLLHRVVRSGLAR